MRYYRINLTRTDGTPVYLKSLQGQPLTSLTANGKNNPGALKVEWDIPINPQSTGDAANGYIKVWGVGLEDITRQADYNNLNIAVYGGMSAGLPLANPQQAGLLVHGTIWQCYGNWLGNEQSLVFIVGPFTGTPQGDANIPFTWARGTPLSVALGNLFSTAFPALKQKISISPNLVLGYTETGYYQGLKPFAIWLNQRTQPIIGGTYQGVHIAVDSGTIKVWDGTQAPATTTQIQPQDLVGQPGWFSFNEINFQTILRGDIHLGDTIQLPPTIISQTASSQSSQLRNQATFSGKLLVTKAQHFGNSRQPNAASWNTTFWAAVPPVFSN